MKLANTPATSEAHAQKLLVGITRAWSELEATGHLTEHMAMSAQAWDEDEFNRVVADELGFEAQGTDDCEIIVDVTGCTLMHPWLPLRVAGTVTIETGWRKVDGEEQMTYRVVSFTARCIAVDANQRKLAIYSITVEDER